MKSPQFGSDLEKLFPIIEPHCSDSGNFDNALELLLHAGRSLPEAVMMMIPEAWQQHPTMPEDKRAFYEYHSALQEPWDGPASISFTDGHYIGAVLDRNGLRPSRYYITKDEKVVMASEVGVLAVEPEDVLVKGRLQPGRMFLVDFAKGRIIDDGELKHEVANKRPYREWLRRQRLRLKELPATPVPPHYEPHDLLTRMQAFGYTTETMSFMLIPLLHEKKDPLGSMGNDAALECLSDQPRMLYDYFRQLFAQVTNPAIDSIREEIIMSLECYIGPEGNLLETTEEQCHRLAVEHPILTNGELATLRHLNYRGWKTRTIDITYPRSEGVAGLKPALDRICREASEAIEAGDSLIVLSDRACDKDRVPMSTLLACGAVHHHLVRNEQRTTRRSRAGDGRGPRGQPSLPARRLRGRRHQSLHGLRIALPGAADGILGAEWTDEAIVSAYRKGIAKGMLKVMGKMGISTLQSYKGAQIFEAIGIDTDVIDRCFVGTSSRIRGIGFDIVAEESIRRHEIGFPLRDQSRLDVLPNPGLYQWRKNGEKHAWHPHTIAEIQQAARAGDQTAYDRFSKLINETTTRECHLRGLLRFKQGTPIPLDEVEPAAEIVKRFCTGAMSFGSISAEVHETLAVAMNRLGGKSNTGEGGED